MASGKKVALCNAYWTGDGCEEEGQCQKLHLCRYYLQTYCTSNEECRFSHNIADGHNVRVLDAAGKAGLTFSDLKFAYKRIQAAPKRLPEACKFYNGMGRGCKHSDDATSSCPCLHVCKYFILEKCRFGARCSKLHSLAAPQPAKILMGYGINIHDGNEASIVAELRNFYLAQQEQSLVIDFDHPALQGVDRVPPSGEVEDGEIVEDQKRFNGYPPPVPWLPTADPAIPPIVHPFGPFPDSPFFPIVISNDRMEDPILPCLPESPIQGMPLLYGTANNFPEIPNEDNSENKETVSSPSIDDMIRQLRSTAERKYSRKSSDELNELGSEGKLMDTDYRVSNMTRITASEIEDCQNRFEQQDSRYSDSDHRFPDLYVTETDHLNEKFAPYKTQEGTGRDLSPKWEGRCSPNSYRDEDDRQGHDSQSQNNLNYSPYRRESSEARLGKERHKFRRSPSYERHWYDNNRTSSRESPKRSYPDKRYDDDEMTRRSDVQHRNTERDLRTRYNRRSTLRKSPYREDSYREGHERHSIYRQRREHGSSYDRRSYDMGDPWDENTSRSSETSRHNHHRETTRHWPETGRHKSPERRRRRSERIF